MHDFFSFFFEETREILNLEKSVNITSQIMASRAIGKGHPRKFDVDRVPGQPKKRRKITLVFDEEKRRDFLGGFHKRKLQRKKKAAEELQQKLKEEKKRIKQDAREKYKTLLSQRDIPELEELLSKEEYDDEDHTVSILELNVADLAQKSNWIGTNRPVYEDESNESSDDEKTEKDDDEVAGMELKAKPVKKPIVGKKENSQSKKEPETKKEVARAVKRAALKQVTTSKVFQQKQRLERQKNKKRSAQLKMRQEKMLKKTGGKSKKASKKKKSMRRPA